MNWEEKIWEHKREGSKEKKKKRVELKWVLKWKIKRVSRVKMGSGKWWKVIWWTIGDNWVMQEEDW